MIIPLKSIVRVLSVIRAGLFSSKVTKVSAGVITGVTVATATFE
jgi:hypothetical protein